jgi:hypothetical protein
MQIMFELGLGKGFVKYYEMLRRQEGDRHDQCPSI